MKLSPISIITLSIALITAFCSCNNNLQDSNALNNPEISASNSGNHKEIKDPIVVTLEGENTLKFQNLEHLLQWTEALIPLSDSEKSTYIKKYDVDSYLSEFCRFQNAISSLDAETSSLDEIARSIKNIANGSEFYMLYEDPSILLHPILRAKSLTEAMVANVSGKYIIGEQVKSIELFEDFDDFLNSNLTSVITSDYNTTDNILRNGAYIGSGNYKVWFDLRLDMLNKVIGYRGTSQKRVNVFSLFSYWTVYKGSIFAKLSITPSKNFIACGTNGYFKDKKIEFPKVPFPLTFNDYFYLERIEGNPNSKTNPPFIINRNQNGVIYFNFSGPDFSGILGYFNAPSNPNDPDYSGPNLMNGKLSIWSNDIGTENITTVDVNINM